MKVIFNGFTEEFDGSNVTIRDILNITNEDDPGVIVEVNGRFVYRKDFTTTIIMEGDRVEFIHPSFGG
ncbi:MAG: sulfur carrier protein ThiS [Desulfomonile sp.]|jgi:sulfur carrier protein